MQVAQTWRFGASLYSGVAYLDNYAERNDISSQRIHITSQFERLAAGGAVTRTAYYGFGGQRVAMRVVPAAGPSQQQVYYLHSDHLGSASLTTDAAGNPLAQMRYYPFGETRWVSGTLRTDRRFTGQPELAGLGIYDYGARMYSPLIRIAPSGHEDCAAPSQ